MTSVLAARSRLPLLAAGTALITLVLLATTSGLLLSERATASSPDGGLPSQEAVGDIPPLMLTLYRDAGARYGIDWSVIAAIGSIETDHGRLQAPGVHSGVNEAGCCAGPMQFDITPEGGSTWAAYGVDGNDDARKDIYDPADAVPAAARYLRANGAPDDYRRAIFAYNHASWYVDDVLERAAAYRLAEPESGAPGELDVDAVLGNPRIHLTPVQRADLGRGLIDRRVIALLAWIGQAHRINVTALRSDHPPLTVEGAVSNHSLGRAVDIGAVDGERCDGSRSGACGRLALTLALIAGPLHSTELIYCFDPDGPASPDAFARPDHCNHIHVGYDR